MLKSDRFINMSIQVCSVLVFFSFSFMYVGVYILERNWKYPVDITLYLQEFQCVPSRLFLIDITDIIAHYYYSIIFPKVSCLIFLQHNQK